MARVQAKFTLRPKFFTLSARGIRHSKFLAISPGLTDMSNRISGKKNETSRANLRNIGTRVFGASRKLTPMASEIRTTKTLHRSIRVRASPHNWFVGFTTFKLKLSRVWQVSKTTLHPAPSISILSQLHPPTPRLVTLGSAITRYWTTDQAKHGPWYHALIQAQN